jgi:hypothetical protein
VKYIIGNKKYPCEKVIFGLKCLLKDIRYTTVCPKIKKE